MFPGPWARAIIDQEISKTVWFIYLMRLIRKRTNPISKWQVVLRAARELRVGNQILQ